MLVVNIIKIIHFILIIYILSSPINTIQHLKYAIGLLLLVIINWKLDSNTCMLTKIEYVLLGKKDMESGFIYRVINPHLHLKNEHEFDKKLTIFSYYYLVFLICVYLIRTYYV